VPQRGVLPRGEVIAETLIVLYLLPALALVLWYLLRRRRAETRARAALEEARRQGLGEPVSLHPVVDPLRCIGSGGCARACPERAIGVVDGKAQLVDPAACIGHGACATACPVEAIRLVFGNEQRGVDIPWVSPEFETSVPGVYVAGELGGMGLLRKAAEQGRQAVAAASRVAGRSERDLVIVGAGPAGLSASLAAKERGLRFVTLEQESSLGGSILHYPRRKLAMTAPVELPLVGRLPWREVSKEALLDFWEEAVRGADLPLRLGERLQRLERSAQGFTVWTERARYDTAAVVLAIGRRGTPRKLDVPGEELPKVVYRLLDPGQYRGRHVLVVGGGDSAVEAALALAEEAGGSVTLSYRGEALSRVKPRNRERFEAALAGGALQALWQSNVARIDAGSVALDHQGKKIVLQNDAVLVFCGGTLPTDLLREIGVRVEMHGGKAYSQSP
jgi:thioredoxin reductase (NADPH)